ncbi:MAG: hypothetical protein IJV21_00810 [Lachnospiraceae bacterium]|nr:hypothetical protein [Lachnospiraceae bacterium]
MNLLAVATSDYIGVILLIAMLISSRIRRSDNEHAEFRVFTIITIMTMIACLVDFLVFYSDGKTNPIFKIINRLGNTYCFMANPVFIASWCLYEDLKLYHSFTRVRRIYRYAFIPAVFMVVIALVNNVFPIIYTIDDNNVYSRLPFSYVYYIVDLGYIFFSIYILSSTSSAMARSAFFRSISWSDPSSWDVRFRPCSTGYLSSGCRFRWDLLLFTCPYRTSSHTSTN